MNIFELNESVVEYFTIQEEINRLQELAESIKDTIKFAMVEIEQEEITGDGWRATWHNTTRKSLDSKALEKAYPDVYSKFLKETTSTRFTLNQIKTA